jgi:NAD(P)-dependent dehydrogenase (short-subunit alcohol dehydrogenase family)
MELNGRVVLITGAKRVGAVLAKVVAARGADVAVTYNRSREEADETVTAVKAAGRRAIAIEANVEVPAACAALVAEVDKTFGRLDVLVNMASIYKNVPFDDMTVDFWEKALAVDLRASFLCAHAAAPIMRRNGGGRIVNFSDWLVASGRPRYKGYLAYYVAKAGAKALTEALALELASDHILVNAIAPGPILAPPGTTEEEYKAVEKATPLGRWGGPEEIAKTVLALIDSDFITGETIRVDGGRHID